MNSVFFYIYIYIYLCVCKWRYCITCFFFSPIYSTKWRPPLIQAAVGMGLDVTGHIEWHHCPNGGNVQASGCHICCDQQIPAQGVPRLRALLMASAEGEGVKWCEDVWSGMVIELSKQSHLCRLYGYTNNYEYTKFPKRVSIHCENSVLPPGATPEASNSWFPECPARSGWSRSAWW